MIPSGFAEVEIGLQHPNWCFDLGCFEYIGAFDSGEGVYKLKIDDECSIIAVENINEADPWQADIYLKIGSRIRDIIY